MSTSTTVLAATIPSLPAIPSTSFAPDSVTVTWTAPTTNGAAISAYIITVRQSDGATYTVDSVNCNGAASTIVAQMYCTIPVTTLRATPYSLAYGSSIFAKVTAINEKGASTESNPGNGAIIITNPDAPISLTEDTSKRTASTLGLTWAQAAFNGGATVTDYQVSMSTSGGAY